MGRERDYKAKMNMEYEKNDLPPEKGECGEEGNFLSNVKTRESKTTLVQNKCRSSTESSSVQLEGNFIQIIITPHLGSYGIEQ